MAPFLHEPRQFEVLWRDLVRFLRRQLTHRGECDDIAQEAMIRALEHPPGDSSQIRSWLRLVALRRASRVARRERARRSREEAIARPEAIPLVRERSDPISSLALRCVHELSEPYRTVVRMRYL
ncbi:MAG: sigma-70 family RNA polymerase sigma factor [Planctomycetes bacterium]|nr:sigma-70 family RNA polymerase sigma factor [Planctomycetota bacterium]